MNTSQPINEALALRAMVAELELNKCKMISSNELAQQFNVKRRTVHDFLSICSVYMICRRYPHRVIEWLGLDRSTAAANSIRSQALAEGDKSDILTMFNYSSEPTLQHIASTFVKLFFYLNVKHLDVRRVAELFGQGKTKYKTMLRKLYTVVSGLEVAGIVRRTDVVSEIWVNVPLEAPSKSNQFTLISVLNSAEEFAQQRKYEARRKEFDGIRGKDAIRPVVAGFHAEAASGPIPSMGQRIVG
jgi:hypothetical protein